MQMARSIVGVILVSVVVVLDLTGSARGAEPTRPIVGADALRTMCLPTLADPKADLDFCLGYMDGVSDMIQEFQHLEHLRLRFPGTYCPPVDYAEIAALFSKYVEAHPEDSTKPAVTILHALLLNKFPCEGHAGDKKSGK